MRERSNKVVSDPQGEFQKVWNVLKLSTEFSVCTNFSKERVPNFHQNLKNSVKARSCWTGRRGVSGEVQGAAAPAAPGSLPEVHTYALCSPPNENLHFKPVPK